MSLKEKIGTITQNLDATSYSNVIGWILFSVVVGLSPVIIGILFIDIDYSRFTANGDITILSLSLLSGTFYTFLRGAPRVFLGKDRIYKYDEKFPASGILGGLVFIIIIAAVSLFTLSLSDPDRFTFILNYWSGKILIAAIVFGILVELLNESFTSVKSLQTNVVTSRMNDSDNLLEKFEGLDDA